MGRKPTKLLELLLNFVRICTGRKFKIPIVISTEVCLHHGADVALEGPEIKQTRSRLESERFMGSITELARVLTVEPRAPWSKIK